MYLSPQTPLLTPSQPQGSLGMTRTAVATCTDCQEPVEQPDLVWRLISSSLSPVPFHEDCYALHVPAPREPLGDEL